MAMLITGCQKKIFTQNIFEFTTFMPLEPANAARYEKQMLRQCCSRIT